MTNVSAKCCALLNVGGTIGEIYDADGLQGRSSAAMLLTAAGLPRDCLAYDIAFVDSVEVTFDTIHLIAKTITADRSSIGFILCCGTDLLEEIAYAATLLLPCDRPIVVTAAALPASEPGSDGSANLRRSAALIASGLASGTTIVMGDAIFNPAGITKVEPQALQPFTAADGPVGRFRSDAPYMFRPSQRDDRFRGLMPEDCQARVAILSEYMGGSEFFVDPAVLDGLVVAGAGAGGLNSRTREMLRKHYLPAMPVVLSTRCAFGFTLNPDVPKHAMAAARADGFRIDGYTDLSAVQARLRLILEIGLTRRETIRS